MAAALLAKVLPFDLFETRRLLGAAVGIAGLAITWRIGRRIGGSLAGLLALVLLATCPLYYGHMFMNPKDAPFAVAMALFLLGLIRLLDQYPKPCPTTLFIVGLGFGLSIGSRVLAGFGVLEAIGALALLLAIEARAGGIRAAVPAPCHLLLVLIPSAILAYAVMALIWPWARPIRSILSMPSKSSRTSSRSLARAVRRHADRAAGHATQLCAHVARPQAAGDFSAFGRSGRYRRTVLGVSRKDTAALARHGFRHRPGRRSSDRRGGDRAPAMYNGVRHFVFVLPPLAVAGGLAGAWIANWIAGHAGRFARPALAALALIFAAAWRCRRSPWRGCTPYEYVSYNHIVGGTHGAQPRFMLDYWGWPSSRRGRTCAPSSPCAARHLPQDANGGSRCAAPHPPARIALGDQFEPVWEPKGADFALMLGVFYCAKLEAPLLTEVVRDGVSFARAYDIRGRAISTLFTHAAGEERLGRVSSNNVMNLRRLTRSPRLRAAGAMSGL